MPVTLRYIDSRGDATRGDNVCFSYRGSTGNGKSAGLAVAQTVDFVGGCSRTRTCDPLIKSPESQLENQDRFPFSAAPPPIPKALSVLATASGVGNQKDHLSGPAERCRSINESCEETKWAPTRLGDARRMSGPLRCVRPDQSKKKLGARFAPVRPIRICLNSVCKSACNSICNSACNIGSFVRFDNLIDDGAIGDGDHELVL